VAGSFEFRILGPLEVLLAAEPIRIGGPKQRALLALLLLSANRVVSRDRLIAELFGDDTPTPPDTALRVRVSRLRAALRSDDGQARLVARAPGYVLRVEPDELDLVRFERLVTHGRERLAANDAKAAAEVLGDALSLWRGLPLADLEFEPFVRIEIERLEELRLSAVEEWVDAELAIGRHARLVPELEALTAEHPLRERLRSQLMLALYRSGRQAEGLEIYRRTRTLLQQELGLEPGRALKELHRAMLAQEPSLEFRPPPKERATAFAAGDVCPFKGLAPYERADTTFFFGRERIVEELVALARDTQLIALVGASGSGKSSLLRAGLLPALAADWRGVVMRPGAAPLPALERALGTDPPSSLGPLRRERILIAVDQFEELFTACRDEAERRTFVDRLVDAAWDPERRVLVALALRADFFGRLAAYPELAQLVGSSHVLLGSMNERELAHAIEGPCERVRLVVEPALVAALVREVAGEPGGLPLLSTTLLELWQKRQDGRLTFASYEQTGGVRGAVARLAERAYAQLDGEERGVAQRLLLRLVAGSGDEPAVRRLVPVAELEADENRAHARVLEVLTSARLVTSSHGSVEIAHEALLTHWPRFREWLEEDAHGRAIHRHLIQAAAQWEDRGHDESELYRGARLAAALDWLEDHGEELNARERAFVEASRRALAEELERERQTNRRLRRQRALALALVAVAIATGALALVKHHDAQAAARAADAQRLGSQALIEPSLDRALLLARAGVALDDSLAARSNLLAALLRSPAAIAVLRGSEGRPRDEALSPDGRRLAVRGDDGTTSFFDTQTFRRTGRPLPGSSQIQLFGAIGGPLHALAFSPDGRTLAIGATDGTSATLQLVDTKTHRRRTIEHDANALIADVVYSPDGRRLATGEVVSGNENPRRETIVVRDPRTGLDVKESAPIQAGRLVGFADGGRRILVTRGRAPSLLLDARTLRRVRTFPPASVAAVSPKGSDAAFGHPNGSVTIVQLQTGLAKTLRGRASSAVTAIAFARGGTMLATGDANGSAATWTRREGLRETFVGHSAEVQGLLFGRDGRILYTAAKDASAIAWDVSGSRRLEALIRFGSPSAGPSDYSAISPDGSIIAVSPAHNRVELLSARTRRPAAVLAGPIGDDLYALRFSPDGTLLAARGSDNVVVWDVATRGLSRLLPGGGGSIAFSADSSTLAYGRGGQGITLYDLRTGDEKRQLPTPHGIDDLDFNRDGTLLVAASLDGVATVWALPHAHVVARLPGQTADYTVRFAPDGKHVAVGDSTGAVVIWNVDRQERQGAPLVGHDGGVLGVGFDRTGKLLMTASGDGKLRLWDLSQRRLIGEPLPGTSGGGSVEFFPDGRHAFGMWQPGTGVIWDVDPSDWAARACSVANRNLTRAEWKRFVPGAPYRTICKES
jgi:WD40 repeat protein/DNA-binding SARP family transcriptional activator